MGILILGYVAATITTISFIPQVIKVVKTKETKTISLFMYIAFVTGLICWSIYGILVLDYAIIVANSIAVSLSSIILTFKIINVTKGETP